MAKYYRNKKGRYYGKRQNMHTRRRKKKYKKISKGTKALSMPYGTDVRPFPKMYKCPLRYVETVELSSTLDAIANHNWRPDGLYDPNAGIGGHQPLGFDTLSSIYFDYCVLGCKLTAMFYFDSDDTVPPDGTNIIVGTCLDENNTLNFTGKDEMMEENRVKWKFLSRQKPVCYITQKYSCKAFHGVKDLSADDSLWGTASTNPTSDVYINTFAYSQSGSSIPVNCTVKIEYYTLWRNTKDFTQS